MLDAIRRLSDAGYHYIGMDHFAKTGDDLARAQRQGRLHRNFQGYSTRPDCDLIGLGVSAISKIGPTYSQNVRTIEEYYDRLKLGTLPTARGIALDRDDILRRAVIMALMCHFEVSKESIETAHLIKFDEYFKTELAELKLFEDEGPGREHARVDHRDAEGQAAGAGRGDDVRPLPARRPARAAVFAR